MIRTGSDSEGSFANGVIFFSRYSLEDRDTGVMQENGINMEFLARARVERAGKEINQSAEKTMVDCGVSRARRLVR